MPSAMALPGARSGSSGLGMQVFRELMYNLYVNSIHRIYIIYMLPVGWGDCSMLRAVLGHMLIVYVEHGLSAGLV